MQEALRRSEGQLQLEPGTLYRALRRMREAGLVTETAGRGQEGSDERRRFYRLTALGRRVARGGAADGGAGADGAHPRPARQGLR
jgi:DNA-binding PadR family transcriptional regulator